MLALTCAVFFPVLAAGTFFGAPIRGSVSPAGVAVLGGAFIFGVGMQLGGGCASGTLYSAGGGSTRMFVVLAAFIAGSLLGTAHSPWWAALPAWAPTSIVGLWGPAAALAASFAVFGGVAALTMWMERSRHGVVPGGARGGSSHWLRGPWPLVAGAIGLALVNVATLANQRAALGRHLRVRAVGSEGGERAGCASRHVAVLVDPCTGPPR